MSRACPVRPRIVVLRALLSLPLRALLLALLSLPLLPVVVAAAEGRRVVLVGVDGASWRVIDGMVAEGALPSFAGLAAQGVTAELETVEPLVSPVVWTSLATGRSPEAHGISGFLSTRFELAAPTLFERLAGAGLRVGLLEYLVTWPPPPFPGGFVAPGWMRRDGSVWPPDLFERAGVLPWRFDWPRPAFSRAETVAGIRDELRAKPPLFLRLLEVFQPDIAAVTFYAVDRTSHRFWRDAYPGDFEGAARVPAPRPGSLLHEVMTELDVALGRIVATLGPDDVLLLASDHGFQADPERDEAIWVGRTADWLEVAELDPDRHAFTVIREWGAIVVRVHPGPFAEREALLERLADFYRSIEDTSGDPLLRVHVLDAAPRPPEARRPFWDRLAQRGVRWLAARFFGARFDEPAHGWVVARFHGDRMEALGLEGRVRVAGRTLSARQLAFAEHFDGTHHPTAVFLAAGGPIRAVAERGRLSVLDVAPLLAYLAGQPLPDDLEGTLPVEWIRAEHRAAHPPRVVPAADAPRLAGHADGPVPSVGDEAMTERLRALGYVR